MMKGSLPKVIPVDDLKDTEQITKICKESSVPIIITNNGYGEMVLMSMELYEKTMAALYITEMVNAAIDEVDSGAQPTEAFAFLNSMKEKYGEKSIHD